MGESRLGVCSLAGMPRGDCIYELGGLVCWLVGVALVNLGFIIA